MTKSVQRGLDRQTRLALARNPDGSTEALLADCVDCAADALIAACGGPPRDAGRFRPCWPTRARGELADAVRAVLAHVQRILTQANAAETRLAELTGPALDPRSLTSARSWPACSGRASSPRPARGGFPT